MFRDVSGVKPNKAYFGSGSIMKAGHEKYLVVGGNQTVRLFDLNKFELIGSGVTVEDPNYLTEQETRDLGGLLQYTLSDFDIDCAGLKGAKLDEILKV